MKAFLINPGLDQDGPEITEVEYNDYKDICRLIGNHCDMFSAVGIGETDTIYVDDEGLINGTMNKVGMFRHDDYPDPLAGRGVVLGTDYSTGDSIEPSMSLEELKAQVGWYVPGMGITIKEVA